MAVKIEVCVDSSASLAAAVQGGADRVELCSALTLGGLTPSAGFMAEAGRLHVQVFAMIRPRAGDFVFSDAEVAQMETDIATARHHGLAGVVLGASLPDGRLDAPTLARLLRAADGLHTTLHRAFDLTPDQPAAMEAAFALGFGCILTSGGALSAVEGAAQIKTLITQAAGRIVIMPGSGVSPTNAAGFVAMGARWLHASCTMPIPTPDRAASMGFGPAVERRTDPALVRALRQSADKSLH